MKPALLVKLTEFMQRAIKIVIERKDVRALLQASTHYAKGNAKVAKHVYGW
jgi:hypothetical protein